MSTSSRRGSPAVNLSTRGHGQPASIPTVETLEAEPLMDSKPTRALKRKAARIDEEEEVPGVVGAVHEQKATASKTTTQSKRPKGKGKAKR